MTSLKPLAERMRPTSLEHYFGQSHLVGAQGILRPMLEQQRHLLGTSWGGQDNLVGDHRPQP